MSDMDAGASTLRKEEGIDKVYAIALKSGIIMNVSEVSFANVVWSDPNNTGSEMRSGFCLLVTHEDDERLSGHRAYIPVENIAAFYVG